MVHQGESLPLGLEPRDDLLRIHARLDDLERHLATHGLRLLGQVDDAHSPFADHLRELVGADDRAEGSPLAAVLGSKTGEYRGPFEKLADLGLGGEEHLDATAKVGIPTAGLRPGRRRALSGPAAPTRRRRGLRF